MKRSTLRLLAPAAILCLSLIAAVPAQAEFPEGWSLAFQDVTGGITECVDFVRCSAPRCPAVAFGAAEAGSYANVTGDFETGRTRTDVIFRTINWFAAFAVAPTAKVTMDVTCSRLGFGLWTFFGLSGAPASCGAEVTVKGFGGPTNFNESYSAVTLDQGVSCADFFGPDRGPLEYKSRLPRR